MDIFLLLVTVAGLQIAAASSPGPNFVLVSSYSTTRSLRQALISIIGIIIGILIWSSLAILGLGALISSSPTAYALVQYLGAIYLIWLGIKMLISSYRKQSLSESEIVETSASSPLIKGFLVNIGNPKTIAYYTSLFAVLIPPESTAWLLIAVVIADAVACAAWWVFVARAFSLAPVKQFFGRFSKQIDRVFGTALVCLGLRLALDRN